MNKRPRRIAPRRAGLNSTGAAGFYKTTAARCGARARGGTLPHRAFFNSTGEQMKNSFKTKPLKCELRSGLLVITDKRSRLAKPIRKAEYKPKGK